MTRPYNSPLREDQTQRTREIIVDALIEQLLESGRSDFSFADVAKRAGVAVRTVHRHFPKREDLLEAIDQRFHNSGAPALPTELSTVRDDFIKLVDWFDEHAELVEAMHITDMGRELREHGRKRRGEEARKFIDKWLPELSERERMRMWAVMRSMFGSFAWRTMRRELGLSQEEATDTFSWMVDLVVKDIERRRKQARRKGKSDE